MEWAIYNLGIRPYCIHLLFLVYYSAKFVWETVQDQ